MSREDLIRTDGVVTKVHAGGIYQVKLDQGYDIQARLCGQMRRHNIRVMLGDRVTVGLSPYDLTRGLIVYRVK